MPDRHRNPAVTSRLPAEDKQWLADYAERMGRDISAIIADLVADFRRRVTQRAARAQRPRSGTAPSTPPVPR